MSPLRVRRRPDGVIELRRRRLRDSVVLLDAAKLLCLFVVCMLFLAGLAAALVAAPVLIAVAAAFALPSILACVLARHQPRLVPAPAPPPPGRAA